MRGNLQVRFLGEGVAVMSLPYPTVGAGETRFSPGGRLSERPRSPDRELSGGGQGRR